VEIRAGYDIAFQCFQDTPMTLMLSIEPARLGTTAETSQHYQTRSVTPAALKPNADCDE
jgi:hypothetical protein